ncbi:alpha/beta hydrolase [Castellaniella sp. FW104-16D08]|uniref:alpha/beta fold hydrolase n=1 Tax=unclassified Castellaniella TaxID=2617606 RepID=UPI003314AAD4
MKPLQEGTGSVTVLAVHGIQGTAASWLPVARALKDQAHFVMPNLRGRADAVRGQGADDYRLPCFAQDLAAAIDEHIGTQPYYLAGWSLGVSIALEYLGGSGHAIHPPRGLILLSGSPRLCRTRWFAGHDTEALKSEAAQRVQVLGMKEAADPQAAAWTWQAICNTDQSALLARIRVPTLVIHGTEDADSPFLHGLWLARGIAQASMHPIEGVGHGLPSGATAEVAAAIRQFIAQREHTQETQ